MLCSLHLRESFRKNVASVAESCAVCVWCSCCTSFFWGEGKRAASSSTNQRARLLRRTSAGSAGERALPRDTAPPPFPSPFLIIFFFCTSSFTNCFLLFLPLLALLFLLCYSSLLFFPFSLSVSPSPHLIHRSQWKQAVIRSANGGFSHMAVTQSSRAKLSYFIFLSSISISQLCCVRRNSVCFRWLFSQFLRMRYQMDDHIHMLNLKTPFIIHPPPLWHGYVDLWEIELPLINH